MISTPLCVANLKFLLLRLLTVGIQLVDVWLTFGIQLVDSRGAIGASLDSGPIVSVQFLVSVSVTNFAGSATTQI